MAWGKNLERLKCRECGHTLWTPRIAFDGDAFSVCVACKLVYRSGPDYHEQEVELAEFNILNIDLVQTAEAYETLKLFIAALNNYLARASAEQDITSNALHMFCTLHLVLSAYFEEADERIIRIRGRMAQ